ncbi:hypothetical protein JCM3775_006753 [Rhodotorula graminis]
MPFLDLPRSVRMYFEVLQPDDGTATVDPTRPTLVTLVPFVSPTFMDVPQLRPGSSLRANYQIVALSPRSHGRTTSTVRPEHDPYVSAADVAFAFEALKLPPSPIYAPGFIAGRIAVALAVLFPDLVTSLALIGVSGCHGMTTVEGFRTLDASMFNPEEPADLYETLGELAKSLYNDELHVDAFDDLMNFLLRRHNPRHALHSFELCRLAYLNVDLTPEALASIQQPVLALHGGEDQYTRLDVVQRWTDQLYRSTSVETPIIPGAPHLCWTTHPETTTALISSFLARHAPTRPLGYTPPDFAGALHRTATLFANPDALLRDPGLPESFSSLTAQEAMGVAADIERIAGYEAAWRARPLIDGAEGVDLWEEECTDLVPQPRWRWSRRNDLVPPISRANSVSVATEVVVSTQRNTAALATDERPRSFVEVSVSPSSSSSPHADAGAAVPGARNGAEDDDSKLSRKDSGFADGLDGEAFKSDLETSAAVGGPALAT